ncbi:MAG: hypothetical protein LBP79_04395 [Clostridiales bacterium]|nr:hypothetical protein [Clostridiales bacterium]
MTLSASRKVPWALRGDSPPANGAGVRRGLGLEFKKKCLTASSYYVILLL